MAAGDAGLAAAQYDAATNMTDTLAALSLLVDTTHPARDPALAAFHARWRADELVLDKWFSIQAMSARPDAMAAVRALQAHPDFDLRNPNRARSLIGAFASGNPQHFHAADGTGYRFLADAVIALDPINASMAARLISPLGLWRRQAPARAALMRRELQRILDGAEAEQGAPSRRPRRAWPEPHGGPGPGQGCGSALRGAWVMASSTPSMARWKAGPSR